MPSLRRILFAGISCLAAVIYSCQPMEITNAAPAVNAVKAGETFVIILPEDHSKFFIWKLKDINKKVIDHTNSVWHGNEKGIYFHFKALQSGQDTLNFVLYKYNAPEKNTSFIVKVE